MIYKVDTFTRDDYRYMMDDAGPAISPPRQTVSVDFDRVRGISVRYKGDLICCGGVNRIWQGRAIAWCMFHSTVQPFHMVAIHRYASFYLDAIQKLPRYRRLEMTVQDDFCSGHKWARMLGFAKECAMKCFGPDGSDHILYSRVK